MASVYPWLVFLGAMILLLLMSYIIYNYFADPGESYPLAMIAVVLSLTISILCTLLIPIDIYVISEGDITSQTLHFTISQDHVRFAYMFFFSALMFLAFFLVPFAYFYGEERGDVEERVENCSQAFTALRSTAFFVAFVGVLLTVSLNFRPGHTEAFDWTSQDNAIKWVGDLLDIEHSGLNALSFCIAVLTFMGVLGWVFYTAYGMAALPFDWLRGKQSAMEQRSELEESIAAIREKYRTIQAKYASRDDGSMDLSRMKAADRKELNRLQREQKSLTQHNYRLQELEQKAGAIVPQLLLCLVPFRWMIGMSMMSISLLVVTSLLLTLSDRTIHSPCGWSCGFTIKERIIFNPADEIFLWLSKIFPIDFILLGVFVLYIFFASMFGIVGLGIRILCFNVYALRSRKSMPQALLVLCNVMAHILLALCMALMTIAPNYTAFGSQTVIGEDGTAGWCTLEKAEARAACQISVISMFFARIAVAMPFFSVAYYFANWAFIIVFCCVFAHSMFCQRRQAFAEITHECEEEEVGLLSFT
eukprot:gnl/TRDRNA2_/TRDRNA2_162343_c0_seq2.p1 gnl/TRDRNA2_/TRDRNA2_162343_c0~~gnl/TRDRNA2_/TRDRNA2_162343_c0_seq2.p1  ORF type:complete len:533 (+),score=97.12 gnl/TRDRNA2_/TRDRNA2_162343_c0_seq2:183-1781(+)